MRFSIIVLSIFLPLILVFTACSAETKDTLAGHPPIASVVKAETSVQKPLEQQDTYVTNERTANANVSSYQIVTETYTYTDHRSNFTIKYPQITNLRDEARQQKINELIKHEAIPQVFFGRPTDDTRNWVLRIDYKITWQSDMILSIQYIGGGYVKGTPHPNNYFYTTNIDISKIKKLVLRDLIKVDAAFAEKLRDDDIKTVSPHPGALSGKQIFIEHTSLNSLDETITKVSQADIVDAKGLLPGIYCYFTPSALGISAEAPHAIGDHAEFEIKYTDIADNIRVENEVWKDFISR